MPPRVINRFLRSLPQENQLILLTDMVEKWGEIGAERAMFDLMRQVTSGAVTSGAVTLGTVPSK